MNRYVGTTFDEFKESAERAKDLHRSFLILLCDDNNWPQEDIDKILTTIKTPLVGGIYPAIICDDKKMDKGFIIVGFPFPININIIENLSHFNDSEQLSGMVAEFDVDLDKDNSAAIMLDGNGINQEEALAAIYDNFGSELSYIGGGSGSLSFESKNCLCTNKGLIKDAVVLATYEPTSSVAVRHGWKKLKGPFLVTKSNKKDLIELDYRPALEVYKENLDRDDITTDNFLEIAKEYAFGIKRMGGEIIVRDPLSIDGNTIICGGNLPTNSYVDILSAGKDEMIKAAKQASQEALSLDKDKNYQMGFVIDCISRALFMGDDFTKELQAINQGVPIVGTLSLGEVAYSGNGFLEFYNKTTVISYFKGE